MTGHTEDTLRGSRIFQIINLLLAISTSEAARAEGLLSGEDSQIFDLVPTGVTAVGTIVADEGTIAEEEEDGVGVKE